MQKTIYANVAGNRDEAVFVNGRIVFLATSLRRTVGVTNGIIGSMGLNADILPTIEAEIYVVTSS